MLLQLDHFSTLKSFAVDWITGNIYYIDSHLKHISVISADGLHCAVVIEFDRSVELSDLAIDPVAG